MSTKQEEIFEATFEVPQKVKVTLDKHMLHVEGPLGKTHKNFKKIPVELEVKDNKVRVRAINSRKKYFAIANTAYSIIRTLCDGVLNGYTIKMKIIYAHFPITVKTKDGLVLVENFQGERAPRIAKIRGQTKVVSKGDEVVLTGPVLSDVTQTAADIQARTKVRNKDHRVFLDGIYQFYKEKGIEK
ncbi:MAG: 50S ribosomal protein L6 [Candidatus Nitrosotenuis sp.]|nr:50S ribosomal protein L6 [Candidatus Nitrosotenuis sp.]